MAAYLVFALASVLATGCAGTGAFVWVDNVPASEFTQVSETAYAVAAGDMVNVRVFGQDAMSTRTRVRPDGKIAVPLVGEVQARGRHPADLAKDLEGRFKQFLLTPAVTVAVEEMQPVAVAVIGEVARPGLQSLDAANSGVLQALAGAGGPTEFADRDRIFVFRRSPQIRIRFTYETLTRGLGRGAAFSLQTGDVVVVE